MAEHERIVTDVGLTLPRVPWSDRILVRFALPLSRMAFKTALRLDSQFRAEPELRRQAETLFDDVRTLLDVIDDFEKHKISGHVVSLQKDEVLDQPNSGFAILPLVRARQKAKNRRVTQ